MARRPRCWEYRDLDQGLSWPDFVDRFRLPSPREKTRVFRGHTDGTWLLEPALRRVCQGEGLRQDEILHVERKIFEEFKYLGHHYLDLDLKGGGDAWPRHFEALGWVQHYGGPTRCLDLSWSPFVAVYFAMENPPSGDDTRDPAIIAIEIDPDRQLLGWKNLELSPDHWRAIFQPDYRDHLGCALPVADYFLAVPRKLHERFARQQGVALVQVDIKTSLHDLLQNSPAVTRFRLSLQDRLRYLTGLQQMNITRANLFEGPDAWAKSLHRCAWEVRARRDE